MNLKKVFDEKYFEDGVRNRVSAYENYRWMPERTIREASSIINNIQFNTVLDYGCGIGDFIRHLKGKKIKISDYLGVDINENYINLAKDTYKSKNFQTIRNVDQISGKWDVVCAIGVFTWYITKEEFIKTINKLHELSNKYVLITTLKSDREHGVNFWKTTYRHYSEEIFTDLFPDMNFEFITRTGSGEPTLLIKINK